MIEITEDYFKNFEAIFLGATSTKKMRESFRKDIQNEYVSKTLSIDIQVKDKKMNETDQFKGFVRKIYQKPERKCPCTLYQQR